MSSTAKPNPRSLTYLIIDDVARLDEWATRLEFKATPLPLEEVLASRVGHDVEWFNEIHIRASNLIELAQSQAPDQQAVYYTVIPKEKMEAYAAKHADWLYAGMKEYKIPAKLSFWVAQAAVLLDDAFIPVRDPDGLWEQYRSPLRFTTVDPEITALMNDRVAAVLTAAAEEVRNSNIPINWAKYMHKLNADVKEAAGIGRQEVPIVICGVSFQGEAPNFRTREDKAK